MLLSRDHSDYIYPFFQHSFIFATLHFCTHYIFVCRHVSVPSLLPQFHCLLVLFYLPVFFPYIHQGHFIFLVMTLIFFFPPYFQGILASVDTAWVCCMSFSAICASDAGFYKLHMAEKRRAIWVLWVSAESQASAAGISKYWGRIWRWPFNLGRYGRSYPGVTVRAPYI